MDINEIVLRNSEFGPYHWIHPSLITGFDHVAFGEKNKENFGCRPSDDDGADSGDEDVAITEYLRSCIHEMRQLESDGQKIPDSLNIKDKDFFDAALYVMVNLRSSYAGTFFSFEQGFVNENNCENFLNLLKDIYLKYYDDNQIANILRNFIIDQYRCGSLWDTESGFLSFLSEPNIKFLEEVCLRGPWCSETSSWASIKPS